MKDQETMTTSDLPLLTQNEFELALLAAEINSLWDQTDTKVQEAVILAARTGVKLNEASAKVDKGSKQSSGAGLKAWLAKECPGRSYDTAIKWMKLPEQFPGLLSPENKITGNFILPLSSMLLLLGSSDEVKETVEARLDAGEKVSRNDIQELNRKWKEAEQAKKDSDEAWRVQNKRHRDRIEELEIELANEQSRGSGKDAIKIRGLQDSIKDLRAEYESKLKAKDNELKNAASMLNTTISFSKAEIAELKAALARAEEDYKTYQADLNKAGPEAVKKLQKDLIRKENEISGLKSKLGSGPSDEKDKLKMLIEFHSSEVARHNAVLVELQAKLDKL
jgi:hypothetical protein